MCKNENAWLPYKIHFNEVSLIEHFTTASLFLFLIRSFFPNNMGPEDCMPFINESATHEKQQGVKEAPKQDFIRGFRNPLKLKGRARKGGRMKTR